MHTQDRPDDKERSHRSNNICIQIRVIYTNTDGREVLGTSGLHLLHVSADELHLWRTTDHRNALMNTEQIMTSLGVVAGQIQQQAEICEPRQCGRLAIIICDWNLYNRDDYTDVSDVSDARTE